MEKTATIAKLNDEFRKNWSKGVLVLTQGIRNNSHEDIKNILDIVRHFDNFDENNDPYGERDMGAFTYKGKKIFWKIDYYDTKLLYMSPDACKPKLTNRVLTVMYAEEY